jgi:hypothetical protein
MDAETAGEVMSFEELQHEVIVHHSQNIRGLHWHLPRHH